MTPKNLMIASVESQYTSEYIANVFWRNDIAKVSKITLIPYLKNSQIYNIAYITIEKWCETEPAYNFIKYLNSPENEARIIHNDDDWFPVQLNTHNNGELEVGEYTTTFSDSYFTKVFDCSDDENSVTAECSDFEEDELEDMSEEEWKEFLRVRPIFGLLGDYYSLDEAVAHLWTLNGQLENTTNAERYRRIELEIRHFERELAIHNAVNKSVNVTERAYKLGKMFHENPEHLRTRQSIKST